MNKLTTNEIKALVKLLDDPNEEVYNSASGKLIDEGNEVIPSLEEAWEQSFDESIQTRLVDLIHKIQWNSTRENLREWVQNGGKNLFKGALLIAKHQYPELNFNEYYNKLEEIKNDIWLEINENLTALEKVRIINHIFFQVWKFSGNTANFFAPQNNYINHVLETGKGNPITLSIIYSSLAEMLNIPIYGVNLPKNFIVAYKNDYTMGVLPQNKILFYINPFNKGAILGKAEIDHFIGQQRIRPQPEYYLPCSNITIMQRLINNLVYAFDRLGYPDKIKELSELYKLLVTKDPS